MAIFKFINEGNFEKVEPTKFENEQIWENEIKNALEKQIDVIAPDTDDDTDDILIIAKEFCEWDDSNRRIDLLGVDKDGNIVVIELKRTETGEHMELQALRYAAMVSTLTFSRATEIYQKYLISIGSEDNAEANLIEFLGWDEPQEDDFGLDVRIILVSANFSKELTTSVMWLNERNLDIRCVRLIPYKHQEQILVDVQQIIPLPEVESYQVKIKKQSKERSEARKSSRDYTSYKFNGKFGLGKRNIVLSVWKKYMEDNQGVSYEKL